MALRDTALWISALLCVACQVGDPLVDEFELEDGIVRIQCGLPPRCELWPAVEPARHEAVPIPLKTCMKVCGWGDIQQDGGCPEPPATTSLSAEAMCQGIELQPVSDAAELSLSDMNWQDVNIVLHAERPQRVVWRGHLQHVYIELHGPIELVLEQSDPFTDVRIQGEASPAGAPRVELTSVEAMTLSIGAEGKNFAGQVKLRAVQMQDIDVRADSLTIENSLLVWSSVSSDSLIMTDVTFKTGYLNAKNARMSVFDIAETKLDFCGGDARLVAGSVKRSNVRVCPDTTLRIYNCSLGSSAIDGAFELDDANVEYVVLGVNEPTRVLAFDSRFASTQACANLEQLALGAGSTVKCCGCVDELNSVEAQPACVLDESFDALLKNYCPIWRELESLPECTGDLADRPERIR